VRHRVWPRQEDLTSVKSKKGRHYDVVCANLACDLLVSEASEICARLNPGGKLIVAGLLQRQFDEVRKNLHRFNLTMQVSITDKGWQSGQFVL